MDSMWWGYLCYFSYWYQNMANKQLLVIQKVMIPMWNQCHVQYIPRNMHTVFALLCFVVVIHWLIFPYPSGLLHWHCGNLTIAPVPAKQPWWIWINTSCEFIMNDCITTTKQSTTKPCAYFLGYTVCNTKPISSIYWCFSQMLLLYNSHSLIWGQFHEQFFIIIHIHWKICSACI